METINMILEPDPDGTLHLPLPKGYRHGKVEVSATLKPVSADASAKEKRANAGIRKTQGLDGFWMSPDSDEPLEDFGEYMQ